MASSAETIREKFKSGVYSIYGVPNVFDMDCAGVYVNESAPYVRLVEAQEDKRGDAALKENTPTSLLRATSHGDWNFRTLLLPTNYFDSREAMEDMIMARGDREAGPYDINAVKISIREAMKAMKVDASCDVDYCLKNKGEVATELNWIIPEDIDASSGLAVKKLEQEIFYRMMCKVFGKEIADDQVEVDGSETLYGKSFMIRDFNVLSFDGNSMFGTARRENDYFVFYYDTS